MEIGLKLRGNNLYSNGKLIEFDNNELLLIRDKVRVSKALIWKFHTLKDNEDLSQLAYKFYGKIVEDPSKYWWVIADANESIVNPLDLSDIVGEQIVIPDIRKILLLIQ